MDDKTKTMMLTIAAGAAKKVLMLQAAGLVSHGIISSNNTEVFVSLGMAAIGALWSFWNDYGKVIVLSQLEVLKAKSLAQAAKMKDAGIAPVTVSQIAAQSPTLGPVEVAKVVATLPAPIQANVRMAAVVAMALLLSALVFPHNASAQGIKLKPLTGNVGNDLGITTAAKPPALTGNIEADVQALWKKIGALTKADLNYAMAKAKAANTNGAAIRLQCLQAISDANDQANGTGLKNPDGTDMARPDPALVTGIEDVAELVDNLSPQGRLSTSCAGAAQMFKTNTLAVISAIVTGAAGIAALPAGL
jgi:hypothetical protein